MLVAAAVVVAVALPHVRQGARLLTPEGERMARGGVDRVRGMAFGVRDRVTGRKTAPSRRPAAGGWRPETPGTGADQPGTMRHATHTPPWGMQAPRVVDLTATEPHDEHAGVGERDLRGDSDSAHTSPRPR